MGEVALEGSFWEVDLQGQMQEIKPTSRSTSFGVFILTWNCTYRHVTGEETSVLDAHATKEADLCTPHHFRC